MVWNLSRSLYTMIKFPNPWAKFPWGGPPTSPSLSKLTFPFLNPLFLLFPSPSSLSFPSTLQPWYLICCWDSGFSFYSLGCLLLYTFLSFCSVVITYQSLFYTGPDESSSDEEKQSSCLNGTDMYYLHKGTLCSLWHFVAHILYIVTNLLYYCTLSLLDKEEFCPLYAVCVYQ